MFLPAIPLPKHKLTLLMARRRRVVAAMLLAKAAAAAAARLLSRIVCCRVMLLLLLLSLLLPMPLVLRSETAVSRSAPARVAGTPPVVPCCLTCAAAACLRSLSEAE